MMASWYVVIDAGKHINRDSCHAALPLPEYLHVYQIKIGSELKMHNIVQKVNQRANQLSKQVRRSAVKVGFLTLLWSLPI